MKRFLLVYISVCLAILIFVPVFEADTGLNAFTPGSVASYAFSGKDGVPVVAESAVLLDAKTHKILFASNAQKRLGMASTTKIMTALVALESGKLKESFVIPPEATGIEGSSIYLMTGEIFTLEELLYGLMLESGNDAATAVAIAVAGDVESFVKLMNRKAQQLGLSDTHFDNPHGLSSEKHYTTAADLAFLTACALENPEFLKIVSTKVYRLSSEGRKCERYFSNHNKLLGNYEGMIGVKTGYTKSTGRCLVTAAERGDMRLVAVTLNSSDDWNDHRSMLDYGFGAFEVKKVASKNEFRFEVALTGGETKTLYVSNPGEVSLCLPSGTEIRTSVSLPPFVYAPVSEGQYVGSVRVYANEVLVEEVPLCAESTVKRKKLSFFEKLFD